MPILDTIPKTVSSPDTTKRDVFLPAADRKYDQNLRIDNGWIDTIKKSKDMNEVDNTVVGQWENKPLLMKDFLGFPEHVKNYYKPNFIYEFQKNKFGQPNNYQEMNMKPSPGGVGGEPMYIPSSTVNKGNNVGYIGSENANIDASSILSKITSLR
jgi:hypothetical protein